MERATSTINFEDIAEIVPPAKVESKKTFSEKTFSAEDIAEIIPPSQELRPDGTRKGPGFLGTLERPDGGVSTELSIGVDFGKGEVLIPTLVPTLTEEEKNHLLSGKKPTQTIVDKAVSHAQERMKQGKSPFADKAETATGLEIESIVPPGEKFGYKGALATVAKKAIPMFEQTVFGLARMQGEKFKLDAYDPARMKELTSSPYFQRERIKRGLSPEEWQKELEEKAKKGISYKVGSILAEWGKKGSERVNEKLEEITSQVPEELRGRLLEHPEYLANPKWLIMNTGDAAVSIVPTIIAYGVGGPFAAGFVGGGMEGTSLYDDLIAEGVKHEDAAMAASAFGLVTGVLNAIGAKGVLGASTGKTFALKILGHGKAGTVEAVTEYLEEPFQAAFKSIAEGKPVNEVIAAIAESLKNIEVMPGAFITGSGGNIVSTTAETKAVTEEAPAPKPTPEAAPEAAPAEEKAAPAPEAKPETKLTPEEEAFVKEREKAEAEAEKITTKEKEPWEMTREEYFYGENQLSKFTQEQWKEQFGELPFPKEGKITIYRGAWQKERQKMEPGDWVTLDKKFAKENYAGQEGIVLSKEVPLEELMLNKGTSQPGKSELIWRPEVSLETYSEKGVYEKLADKRKRQVQQAISEGKPVPAEVLAEYPELKPKTAAARRVEELEKPKWRMGEERPFAFDPNSTKNEGRFRLRPPTSISDYFQKDVYTIKGKKSDFISRGKWAGEKLPAGIRLIVGKTQEGNEEVQAVRFNKNNFTEEEAATWWGENKELFKGPAEEIEEAAPIKAPKRKRERGPATIQYSDVLSFIRKEGGITPEGAQGETIRFSPVESATTGLVSESGLKADEMRARLQEAGHLPEGSTIGDMWDLMDVELWRSKNIATARGELEIPGPETRESVYQNLINRMAAIENATDKARELGAYIPPGRDAGKRAREYLGIGGKVQSILKSKTFRITKGGNIEITGEGLYPILEDYDSGSTEKSAAQREIDLNEYLIAKRTIEDLQRPKHERTTELIVTEKQVADSKARLKALTEKYGNLDHFEAIADRLYKFQSRMLHTLVESGVMSQELYNKILARNRHYIPFQRILDEVEPEGASPRARNIFTGARSPIKRIKGSEREIYDPIESIIKNTYRIADIAERNYVAQSIADLKEISGMGITEIKPPLVPVAEVTHRAAIDRDYLAQVKEFAEGLGAKVVTAKKQPGQRLGEYGAGIAERRFATPEEVISHEVGHFLDEKYKLKERFYKGRKATREVGEEIYEFMKAQGQSASRLKKVEERFAHAFEWWLSNRALAEKDIPAFSKVISDIIEEIPDLKPMLSIRPTPGLSVEAMTEKVFRPSQFKPKGNVIEYFENGDRKFIEVPRNLYESMSGLNETSVGIATRIMSMPAHWLRVGATITPEFMFRNPIRDQLTALIQTRVGFIPFVDTAGAIADIIGKTDIYYDWIRTGGANSSFVELTRQQLRKKLNELKRNTSLLSKLNIIARAQDMSQLMEQATRLAVYKTGVKKGLTPVEAGFESREATIDFFRRGSKTKDINAVIAFFNAGVQGFDKSIRTFKKYPVSSTAKAIISITIPSIICYLINKDDPDYKELPRWQKDLFWCPFKIPGTHIFVRIPKPFLFGQIFGSVPERLMEYIETKDPGAFKDLYKSVLDSVLPSQGDPSAALLPTMLKPLIENATNWSFFRERPVVPESRKELLPYMQHGKYTPEAIKEIGKVLNMSPSKIENLIRGYAGGTGAYAMEALDWLIEREKRERPAEPADYPLVKGFVTRPAVSQPKSLDEFYERSTKLIQVERSYKRALKDRNREEARAIRKKYPELVHAKMALRTRKRISTITHMIDVVINSKMENEKKRDKIERLEIMRMRTAQRALERIKKYGKKRRK